MQPDAGAAAEVAAVAGEHEEVHRVRDRDRPREVACEDEGALQHRDQDEVAGCVVAGDLRAELVDPRADLVPGEIDLAGARILYVTRFRPYF